MNNFSASIPVERASAINEALAEMGHGPSNFSVPCGDEVEVTHAALHCWPNDAFRAALEELTKDYPELKITDGTGEPNLEEHIAKEPFELIDVEAFTKRISVMDKGEKVLVEGVEYLSKEDSNIWPVGTIGWIDTKDISLSKVDGVTEEETKITPTKQQGVK
jgi:hypothetical protein